MRGAFLTLIAIVLVFACPAGAQEIVKGPPPERPNILLVVLDDAVPGHLRAMPETRALVGDEGLKFSRAYAVDPECCPARATILTGKYSHNHGVLGSYAPYAHPAFKPSEGDTIATRLDGAGYETALIGKYMNGYSSPGVPPGWDHWRARLQEERRTESYEVSEDGVARKIPRKRTSESAYYAREARRFVEESAGSPWFTHVSTRDPHAPFFHAKKHAEKYRNAPLPPGVPRTNAEKWRDSLRSTRTADDLVGSLADALKETGQLENTYVVVTSDNGHTFGRYGYWGKSTPYEEAVRVPMFVRGPGVPVGERDGLVGLHDLAPTFAGWAGADPPAYADGRSIAPLVADPAAPWRDALLLEHREPGSPNDWAAVRTAGGVYAEGSYAGDGLTSPADADLSTRLDALKGCSGESCRAAEGP